MKKAHKQTNRWTNEQTNTKIVDLLGVAVVFFSFILSANLFVSPSLHISIFWLLLKQFVWALS